MTRETGIKMVEKYATRQPEDLGLFLNWIDMSESEFFNHIDKFRDEKAWQKVDSTWMLRDSITNHRISADSFLSDIKDDCDVEILISDNCSTDKTPSIIKKLQKEMEWNHEIKHNVRLRHNGRS